MDIPLADQHFEQQLTGDSLYAQNNLILNMSDELSAIVKQIGKDISRELDHVILLPQIPEIIRAATHRVDDVLPSEIDLDTRVECVTKVLFYVIDNTVTKDLPDVIFDPIFKSTIQTVMSFLLPGKEESQKYRDFFTVSIGGAEVDSAIIKKIGNKIIAHIGKSYIGLNKTHDILALTIKAAQQFVDLSAKEREYAAIAIFDYVIDETDFIYIPDFIFDPMIKQLYKHIIPILL